MAIGNSVNDEIREQHKYMKDKPFKEKFEYYAGYYWKHVLIIAAVVIFVTNFLYTVITAKDEVLCVLFVNTFVNEDIDLAAYTQEFADIAGIDTEECQISLQTDIWINYDNDTIDEISSANLQKLLVMNSAGAIDAMVIDDSYLEENGPKGVLGDLRDFLPADILEKYEDRLIYVDVLEDDKGEYPAAIDVSDAKLMAYDDLSAYFCCVQTVPHQENMIKFLEYFMEN